MNKGFFKVLLVMLILIPNQVFWFWVVVVRICGKQPRSVRSPSLWGWFLVVKVDSYWVFWEQCLLLADRSEDSSVHVLGTLLACGSVISGSSFISWDLSLPGNECSPGFMRGVHTSQFLSSLKVTSGGRKDHGRPQETETSVCRQLPEISHEACYTSKLGLALPTSESKTETNYLKANLVEVSGSQGVATKLLETPVCFGTRPLSLEILR